jgi:hypothetical protein
LTERKPVLPKGVVEELGRCCLVMEHKVECVSRVSHAVGHEEYSTISLAKRQGSSGDKWLIMVLEEALIFHSENLKVCLVQQFASSHERT